MLYIIWFALLIPLGYAVYNAFGFSDPSVAPALHTQGLAGWLAIVEAHRYVEQGHKRGHVVITVAPTGSGQG